MVASRETYVWSSFLHYWEVVTKVVWLRPTYFCVGTKTWIKCPVQRESAMFLLYFLKCRMEAKFKANGDSFVLPLVISFLMLFYWMRLHPVKLWVNTSCFIPCSCLTKLLTCVHFYCYCMWCWCARSSVWIYGYNIRGRGAVTMMMWALVTFLLLTWNFTVPQTPVRVMPWGTRLLCSIVSDPIQYWQVPSCFMMSWLKMHWKLDPNDHLTIPICLLLFFCYPYNFQLFPLINCLYNMILFFFLFWAGLRDPISCSLLGNSRTIEDI